MKKEVAIIGQILSQSQENQRFEGILPVGLGRQNIMHAAYACATANLMFANRRKPYCVHIAMRLLSHLRRPRQIAPDVS
jgi:hypothetical protein